MKKNYAINRLDKFSPETRLLDLFYKGVPIPGRITINNMKKLVYGTNNSRLEIYFSCYWKHESVLELKNKYSNKMDLGKIIDYINNVHFVINERKNRETHWIERINLFHFYGLLRILGFGDVVRSKRILAKQIREEKFKIKTLVDISVLNSRDVLEGRDPSDITEVFYLLEQNPMLLRDFGNYQIYYYDGIENCVKELEKDFVCRGKVPIPHSILALRAIADREAVKDDTINSFIMDSLYDKLPQRTKARLDSAYKKTRRYFDK